MTLLFRPARAAFAVSILALVTLPACDSGPQPGHEAEYWGKKLQEGELTQRDVALTHLAELKSKDAVPFLIEALKGPALELRPRIVEAIGAAAEPSATGALVDAIDWSVGAGRDKESRAAANTNDKVAKALAKQVMPSYLKTFELKVAKLGDDAGAMGAAAWARQSVEQSVEMRTDPS